LPGYSQIFKTGIFTKTFTFGKYIGDLNFCEPMISMGYLKGKPNESFAIRRQPQTWQKEGY